MPERKISTLKAPAKKPKEITVKAIKAEGNAEVRRIMRELYGEGLYLSETGAKQIDIDHETCRKGAAPRMLIKDDEEQLWLVGTDGSTNKVLYMPVEGDIKTCREAHESLSGFPDWFFLILIIIITLIRESFSML